MAFTFRGGLHIDDHKEYTAKIPIRSVGGSAVHMYPLQQHIGAPLSCTVKVGDKVCVGDVLADNSEAFVTSPIHSSVSGRVIAIEPRLHPTGVKVTSVVVENDGLYTPTDKAEPKNPDKMTSEEMLEVIRNAGIVGLGGAGFPTHVKLSPPPEKQITHVIVNGAECEPYLTSDHRRMLETPEDITDGLKIVMKILGLREGYIGIETNKPDAIATMRNQAARAGNIHVMPLKTKYPQGAEKQLIYAITKRRVPNGGLPADVGAIVLNIDTVTQIARTFRTGMPLTERIITISGDAFNKPCNIAAKIGMSVEDIIKEGGGFAKEPQRLILGGPMMGTALFSTDVPIIKTSSALLALTESEALQDKETACIRCGKCVSACPMRLMPLALNKFIIEGRLDMAERYNVMACMECGVCSYLCPGSQNPLTNIRIAKQQLGEERRTNQRKAVK